MSKFCTKCGRPIPEGGICPCQLPAGNQLNGRQASAQQGQQHKQPNSRQASAQQSHPHVQPNAGQPSAGQQGHPHKQPSPQPNSQQMPQGPQGAPQMDGQQMQHGPYQNGQPFNGQQYQGQPFNSQYQGQPFNGQQYKQQASAFAQNFFGRVLNLIKNPVTAGKGLIMEADVKTAFLLIAFQGIFSALFAMAAAGKLSGYILAASGLADGISSGLGGVVAGALGMPYFRIFFVTVCFSIGLACLLALLMMAGHLVLKIPASFQQMISAAAIRSAVLVPAILLSILVFELSAGIGVSMFVLVNIWGFSAMLVAMSAFIRPEKMDLFVLMASIVILLFTFLTIFIFSKIWTLYLPDLIRTALKSMGDMSWQQLLEELM